MCRVFVYLVGWFCAAVNVQVEGDRATGQRFFGDGRTPVDLAAVTHQRF
jgi:hypothetical protein